MIRTVRIPKTVSRMGCSPGGSCCSECAGHGNAASLGRLGDTVCDQDGNCYDTTTGALLSAPLTTGSGCAPGVPSCAASTFSINSTTTYMLAGVAIIALLEFTTKKRR